MTQTICLDADYESARAIGPWLIEVLTALESPQLDRVGELELAIHELAINIVDHAYGELATGARYTITVEPGTRPGDIRARFCDHGISYVPAGRPNLNEPQIGGYGLFIAEQLADSVSYERVDDTNVWTLIFAPPNGTTTHAQETP